MDSKVVLPENICDDEVVGYLAQRYRTTPSRVVARYLEQEGVITTTSDEGQPEFRLTPNEMEIFKDMGIRPSAIEFTKQF